MAPGSARHADPSPQGLAPRGSGGRLVMAHRGTTWHSPAEGRGRWPWLNLRAALGPSGAPLTPAGVVLGAPWLHWGERLGGARSSSLGGAGGGSWGLVGQGCHTWWWYP